MRLIERRATEHYAGLRYMTEEFIIGAKLEELVARVVASYESEPRTQHIDRLYLPSREEIIR